MQRRRQGWMQTMCWPDQWRMKRCDGSVLVVLGHVGSWSMI